LKRKERPIATAITRAKPTAVLENFIGVSCLKLQRFDRRRY
jgi:hypothetical protein